MLPPLRPDSGRLADVLSSSLAALRGEQNTLALAPVRRALVIVVDGLGHLQLKAHAGHARHLASASKPLVSGFPTTTASALTSLATGTSSGTHGLIGYDAFVPGVGVRNQLRDWGADMDPLTHQRMEPLWDAGCAIVAEAKYASSGFTRATLRGGTYLGFNDLDDRVAAAGDAMGRFGLTYLYLPELDRIGHKLGIASGDWIDALERFDGLIGALAARHADAGIVVTADHGMVDVPQTNHVIIEEGSLPPLRAIAGEPRGRQLLLEDPSIANDTAQRLGAALGKTAWVATRDELIGSGWFGQVHPEVLPRLGDVFVLSRGRYAHYFDESDEARGMIGQHGSVTDDEVLVPLVRLGKWRN